MSKLTDWLSKAADEFTAIEHAAMHLIAAVANGETALQQIETTHPMVAEAIAAGTAAATAHGIPVLTIEEMVLAAAKEMTAVMGAPAPEPAPVVSAESAA